MTKVSIFDLQNFKDGNFRANALQQMDLLIRVDFKLAGEENFIAQSLKQAIQDKKPVSLILKTIREMATDNYKAIANMLGTALTDKILRDE